MSPSEIAFWKIVGFDVTPTTASSSIIRASSPVCSRRRERKSIQTLWPSSDSSCRRDLAIGFLPFHLLDLLKPSDVAFPAVEPCNEEGAHQLACQLGPHDLGAEAEHVHIVVLDPPTPEPQTSTARSASPPRIASPTSRALSG